MVFFTVFLTAVVCSQPIKSRNHQQQTRSQSLARPCLGAAKLDGKLEAITGRNIVLQGVKRARSPQASLTRLASSRTLLILCVELQESPSHPLLSWDSARRPEETVEITLIFRETDEKSLTISHCDTLIPRILNICNIFMPGIQQMTNPSPSVIIISMIHMIH